MGDSKTMAHSAFDMLLSKSVPHILEKIFFSLDLESFISCGDVSKSWRSLLTSDRFQWMGKSVFRIHEELREASSNNHSKKVRQILSCFMVDINFLGGKYDETVIRGIIYGPERSGPSPPW